VRYDSVRLRVALWERIQLAGPKSNFAVDHYSHGGCNERRLNERRLED
jgi:hypothetical protein